MTYRLVETAATGTYYNQLPFKCRTCLNSTADYEAQLEARALASNLQTLWGSIGMFILLFHSVADPGSGAFLTLGSRIRDG